MKKIILTRQLALKAGLLLVFPSLYFIVSAFLNYNPGFSSLWKVIEPTFDKPENKQPGLIINILILFGPFAALLINLPKMVGVQVFNNKEEWNIKFAIKRYSWNWILIAVSILCMSSICRHMVAENCTC